MPGIGAYAVQQCWEQIRAVLPISLALILFQTIVLEEPISDFSSLLFGLLSVVAGLALFMEGLKYGLMPLGEAIGNTLPVKMSQAAVLGFACLLGAGVTFAEPALGVLQTAGSLVSIEENPYLYLLLTDWSPYLVATVGMGVGIATTLGMLRILNDWSLKPLIYVLLGLSIALTVYVAYFSRAHGAVGLAWDLGAVTTGPVTVPVVIALGVGVAASASASGEASPTTGFGIVTLASLCPVICVLLLCIVLGSSYSGEQIIAAHKDFHEAQNVTKEWYDQTPFQELIFGVRAFVPLVILLFILLRAILKEKSPKVTFPEGDEYKDMQQKIDVYIPLGFALSGIVVFYIGLKYGLSALGAECGSLIPGAFTHIEEIDNSPLYSVTAGKLLAAAFAWILGFGATLAEPALNTLGATVERLTKGSFKKTLVLFSVAVGVAFGIMFGVLRLMYHWRLSAMLFIGYPIAVLCTIPSSEEFVNVAWDSAGVTTGPVTVPLVVSLGLGFGRAMGMHDGFGILALASVSPILSVLITGLVVRCFSKPSEDQDTYESREQKAFQGETADVLQLEEGGPQLHGRPYRSRSLLGRMSRGVQSVKRFVTMHNPFLAKSKRLRVHHKLPDSEHLGGKALKKLSKHRSSAEPLNDEIDDFLDEDFDLDLDDSECFVRDSEEPVGRIVNRHASDDESSPMRKPPPRKLEVTAQKQESDNEAGFVNVNMSPVEMVSSAVKTFQDDLSSNPDVEEEVFEVNVNHSQNG